MEIKIIKRRHYVLLSHFWKKTEILCNIVYMIQGFIIKYDGIIEEKKTIQAEGMKW